MTNPNTPKPSAELEALQSSLHTSAARLLATTTKTPPQTQGISPRWLLKALPFVEATGGTYRVNRRLSYAVSDGRLLFSNQGTRVQVLPQELRVLPLLRGYADDAVLERIASRFVQSERPAGSWIVKSGQPADELLLLAHGKAHKLGAGKYGDDLLIDALADGDHFGDQEVLGSNDRWPFGIKAITPCTILVLPQKELRQIIKQSPSLALHIEQLERRLKRPRDKLGQAAIELSAGHLGEPVLPRTFVDYELTPREYQLSVAQTILRVHTRVSDIYRDPMDQIKEQLRLTIEVLRERQEFELLNNPDFGLLHNADLKQRLHSRSGPPAPDDLDELLCRRRKSQFFLAHPRTIAAFGRQCNCRGIYPTPIEFQGRAFFGWRGLPILPCDKIPITESGTSSILVMRTGQKDQGVIGLHQTGLADEVEPGLSVRRMETNDKAVASYLVSTYYSAALLVPDALGILEHVDIR